MGENIGTWEWKKLESREQEVVLSGTTQIKLGDGGGTISLPQWIILNQLPCFEIS